MKRRDVIAGLIGGVGFTAGNALLWQLADKTSKTPDPAPSSSVLDDGLGAGSGDLLPPKVDPISDGENVVRTTIAEATDPPSPNLGQERVESGAIQDSVEASVGEGGVQPATAQSGAAEPEIPDLSIDPLDKVRNFNGDFVDDLYLTEAERPVMHSIFLRFEKAERFVGHGNYNLLSFDQLFKYARYYSEIGEFTKPEFALIEKLFFTEAKQYGFFGQKVTTELTAKIPEKDTVKIPHSGHFLLKGDSTAHYEQLRRDIGDSVILTSGIRSNVKQMHLFVAKCLESNYNLSKASRSLAPPGHSYHGIGDFDVGRVDWGYANFTDQFAETDEFKRMQDLGYVQIRYTKDNRYGVRFEPWHIKVV